MCAKMNRLDDYISKFYEENVEEKLKAAKDILELFQNFNNLDELLEHCKIILTQNLSYRFLVELFHRIIQEA